MKRQCPWLAFHTKKIAKEIFHVDQALILEKVKDDSQY